jgi:hypothetical protein
MRSFFQPNCFIFLEVTQKKKKKVISNDERFFIYLFINILYKEERKKSAFPTKTRIYLKERKKSTSKIVYLQILINPISMDFHMSSHITLNTKMSTTTWFWTSKRLFTCV